MTLEIVTIPCLQDNYAFLAHDPESGKTAVIDVPEAGPILEALKARGWSADIVLLTHHHWDHVDGLPDLKKKHTPKVVGAAADVDRLPDLDLEVAEGDTVRIGREEGTVIDVSGHTMGHIAFHFPASQAVFTADSLMALGCGRLFEGEPAVMHESLSKLAALPEATIVYSGHEYTQSNAKFALTVDPENVALQARAAKIEELRAGDQPTVPSTLAEELATNPFLRSGDAGLRKAIGMEEADDVAVFAEVRKRKDNF